MISKEELKEIIEIALDRELDNFELNFNLYNDFGMDSMGAVVMIVEIQRRTGIKIPDTEIKNLLTPQAILGYLSKNHNN